MKRQLNVLFVSIFSPLILLTWILLLFYWIGKKNEMVGNYLLQISVREFHHDLIKTELNGGLESV